ncbi:MAG TPA: DHHA1 domain-containing protein [Ktedonobacterales bacterium]|jgi:alanyl-tRNA synthetase
MPTERLYWNDAYLRQFEARVVARSEYAGKPAVVLDATAFYPEGGGQPTDRGTLEGVAVVDVQEHGGEILHLLDPQAEHAALTPGKQVSGTIDWQRRFDYMQQHSGQHILSGGFWRLCQAETVSWHLGDDYTSVDIATPALSPDAAAEVEHASNEVLWNDLPIEARIYAPAELAALGLRRGPKVESDIRIVSIGHWDAIGCGGTHVLTAGRVGSLGIRRWETRGNVTRVEFLCGQRAVDDYRRKTRALLSIGQLLAQPLDKIEDAARQMFEANGTLRQELEKAHSQLLALEASELLARSDAAFNGHPIVSALLPSREVSDLRFLAQRVAESGGIALLGGSSPDQARATLVFNCDKTLPLDLNNVLQQTLPHIGGRGGGQKFSAQGGGPNVAGLQAALDAALAALLAQVE